MAGFVTEALEEREITLYHHILFAIFGLAPWNVTSALFAQLPLVLPKSPQMAQLPSYMDVATNLGNVPMLLYLFFVGRSAFAKRQPQSLNAATVYVLFAVALLTAAGFAGLWDTTVHNFSIYVVLFALCGGIVGDVMMVTAFPWLTQFHPCAPSFLVLALLAAASRPSTASAYVRRGVVRTGQALYLVVRHRSQRPRPADERSGCDPGRGWTEPSVRSRRIYATCCGSAARGAGRIRHAAPSAQLGHGL
jgi:hypothetical protein